MQQAAEGNQRGLMESETTETSANTKLMTG
jgi:hypothetical protein